jgi:hypothetical protein
METESHEKSISVKLHGNEKSIVLPKVALKTPFLYFYKQAHQQNLCGGPCELVFLGAPGFTAQPCMQVETVSGRDTSVSGRFVPVSAEEDALRLLLEMVESVSECGWGVSISEDIVDSINRALAGGISTSN